MSDNQRQNRVVIGGNRRGALIGGQRPVPQPPQEEGRTRAYTKRVLELLNLPDRKGESLILASGFAAHARIDERKFQVKRAATLPHIAPEIDSGRYARFKQALEEYEAMPPPRAVEAGMTLFNLGEAARDWAIDVDRFEAANEINAILQDLRATRYAHELQGLGTPPWEDPSASRRATTLKVELDLMDVPPGGQQMQKVGDGEFGAVWIKRGDGRGGEKNSFLCKPSAETSNIPVPPGGEVPREALSGRAAKLLERSLGLDLNMPETTVVTLPRNYFPDDHPASRINGDNDTNVKCSVQEGREVTGDCRNLSREELNKIDPKGCQSIALLDLLTLNNDRHAGNLLIDGDGRLVPIDNGCSFPTRGRDQYGPWRLSEAMGGPQNFLLRMPGTHVPMDEKTAKGLTLLDPQGLIESLKQEREAIKRECGYGDGDDDKLVTDNELEFSLAAARFMKIAGQIKGKKPNERLSPATIQVTFATWGPILVEQNPLTDPGSEKQFDALAKNALIQALELQSVTSRVCQFEDAMDAAMINELGKLGWTGLEHRNGPPAATGHTLRGAPGLCMKLIAMKIRRPEGEMKSSVLAAYTALRDYEQENGLINPKAVGKALDKMELNNLQLMANQMPDLNLCKKWQGVLKKEKKTIASKPEFREKLAALMLNEIKEFMENVMLETEERVPLAVNDTRWIRGPLAKGDWITATEKFQQLLVKFPK